MKDLQCNTEFFKKNEKININKKGGKELTGYASIDKPWLKYYKDDVINMKMPKMNVYDYILKNNCNHLGRTALNYFGNKITYEEFFKKIDETANAFFDAGVKKGDIVTVSLPMIPEAIYIFYALAKIGAISNMIDPRTNENGIKQYIEEVKSKILIIFDAGYPSVKNIVDSDLIDKVIATTSFNSMPIGMRMITAFKKKEADYNNPKVISFEDFLKNGKNYKGNTETVYEENLPISIVHTGGTTGFPKGVLLTNDNYNALVEQFRHSGLDFQREDSWLGMIPLFFAYGGGIGLHHPLAIGMEIKVIPMFNPNEMDKLVLKNKANHMAIIPSYFESIIYSKKSHKADFSFLKTPAVGSDKMDPTFEKEVNQFLKEHNCNRKVLKGYGMSEVSSAVCGSVVAEANKIGSVGIPFSHSIISIFDLDTGKELKYGEIGEICITGPNVMVGYYNNEEETNKIMKVHEDGLTWIHSGDIGYITEDGNLYIEGRIKRMIIKYGGFKVFPAIIEKIIMEHPMVENVSVIGVNDLEHPDFSLPQAVVVIKKEFQGIENDILEQIKNICEAKLPDYSVPTYFSTREKLPLTNAGKIDYRFLETEINDNHIKKSNNCKKLSLSK